jgi:uncharacterized protein (TIGR00369 family)
MTDQPSLTVASANLRLAEVFAPWVQDLKLSIESIDDNSVILCLPWSDALCRSHDMVCGQAMMALIDTCMVFVCYASQGKFINCTTVSQNTSFVRPVIGQDIIATGQVIKAGRQMIFGEVTLRSAKDKKTIAHGTSNYMVLPD